MIFSWPYVNTNHEAAASAVAVSTPGGAYCPSRARGLDGNAGRLGFSGIHLDEISLGYFYAFSMYHVV